MKYWFFFMLFIISNWASSQSQKTLFLEKKSQHCISWEYAACYYSYSHRFKKNVTFGLRTQIGLGLLLLLASSPTFVDFGFGNGPEKVTPRGSSFEVFKVQFFYKYPNRKTSILTLAQLVHSVLVARLSENNYIKLEWKFQYFIPSRGLI